MDILIYLDWTTTGLSLDDIAKKHSLKPAEAQQIIRDMEKRDGNIQRTPRDKSAD